MNICVIPARGGSKRIPGKNIKTFSGKPIIAYSIEAALESGCFDSVVVSTDDPDIAKVAMIYGAKVPFMRPDKLANDHAGTLPVIKHAIDWFECQGKSVELACCFYATAPFVDAELVRSVLSQLKTTKANYCFTVTSFPFPIQRAIRLTADKRVGMFHPECENMRSQDLNEAYHDAGQLYWGRAEAFKEMKPLFSEASSPFIMPRHMVQDIDTLDDWKRAELMYQAYLKSECEP